MKKNSIRMAVCALLGIIAGTASLSLGATVPSLSLHTNVGDGMQLLANTPNQQVQVLISGSQLIAGENLNVQISDGVSGPLLKYVDFQTGTIFANPNNTFGGSVQNQAVINTPQLGLGIPSDYLDRLVIESTTTASGSVTASGLLATVTVDTTGLNAGTQFEINLLETLNDYSEFQVLNSTPLKPNFADNTITLINAVPEPASLAMFGAGAILIMRRRRRST